MILGIRKIFYYKSVILLFFLITLFTQLCYSNEINIAVASNFAPTLKKIIKNYNSSKITLIVGSTTRLYSQIKNGAPFDIFFAADRRSSLFPLKKSFIYAKGKIILWSRKKKFSNQKVRNILNMPFKNIAIANPKLAPYGKAALEVILNLKMGKNVHSKIVYGLNVGQAFQFVDTLSVDLGFISLSQYLSLDNKNKGYKIAINSNLYSSLEQEVILINEDKIKFFNYLKTLKVQKIIQNSGYGLL